MLKNFLRKRDLTEEERKKMERHYADMQARAKKLSKLINGEDTGWVEFIKLIDERIDKQKKYKALTRIDTADEKMINYLKFVDYEVYLLSSVKRVAGNFIKELENLKTDD